MISRAKRRALATFAFFFLVVALFLTVACDQNMDLGRVNNGATYPTPHPPTPTPAS